MALEILHVEYYNITVEGQIANASELLSTIVGAGVDFHAFKAIPVVSDRTQFTLFAKDSSKMTEGAKKSGLELEGPYSAILIKGDEKKVYLYLIIASVTKLSGSHLLFLNKSFLIASSFLSLG